METIYDKLQRCLRENKKYLGDDGYIQLEKSPRIKVGLGEYGRKVFAKKLGQEEVWADGLQLIEEELRVWVSTDNSEKIDFVYALVIEEEYLAAIYKEVAHTITIKQNSKTKTPMKEYEINERAILETRAKFMASAKSVEEQEQIRKIADMSATANRELEIERLLTKFGSPIKVLGGVRAAFIKDNRGNDVTIFLVHELVYIVKGELVEGNPPKEYFRFDSESQIALLKCLQADIKEKLTEALAKARKEGRLLSAVVYASALAEEFGEEE